MLDGRCRDRADEGHRQQIDDHVVAAGDEPVDRAGIGCLEGRTGELCAVAARGDVGAQALDVAVGGDDPGDASLRTRSWSAARPCMPVPRRRTFIGVRD